MVAFVSVILEEEEEEEERSKESFRLPFFAFSFEIENFPVPPANFHPRASPLDSFFTGPNPRRRRWTDQSGDIVSSISLSLSLSLEVNSIALLKYQQTFQQSF